MKRSDPFETRSPYEKLEQARRKRLLIGICNVVMIFLIPFIITVGIMLADNFTVETLVVLILAAAIIPVSLLARRLARREKTVAAGYSLLILVMLIIGTNGTIVSSLFPIVVIGYVLCIVVAGMVLGPRQGYVIAGVATVFYLIAQLILLSDVVPSPAVSGAAVQITIFVMTVAAFFFVAVTSNIATQDLRKALDEATYDLLEANHKLALASEMKSQFTARTSHELRTPLSSIIVFTDLALRGSYGDLTPKLEGKLQNVLGSARHLHNIINDLLDLAKIEAGELEIAEAPFAVRDLVKAVHSTMEEAAHQKGIQLNVQLDEDLPSHIIGDEGRIKQILLNLTGNAVKFTDEGKVDVSIDPVGRSHWRITVRDTGPGIPEDRFETIFEEYRQLETASKDADRKGTGLGLAITRNLVEMMGGEITLESELGEGSTFEIVLPLKAPEGVPVAG